MRLSVAVAAVCLSIVGLAVADDVRASIRKPVNIPAQALGPALQTLAKDRDFQVVYVSEEVNSLRTHGAVGEFTSEEALKQLLKGTGLTYRYLDDKTVTIVPTPTGPASLSSDHEGAPKATGEDPSRNKQSQDGAQKKSFWDRFLVAQVDQGKTSSEASVEHKDEQASKKKPVQLEEVLVTGSRIPAAAKDGGAQDVKVYERKQIDQSGQTSVSDFLNTLSDVSLASLGSPQSSFAGTTTVQLHGLPVGTTLVLVNGRRVEQSGANTLSGAFPRFDLNSLPLSAVEKIEVVSAGSSAIYGSDAIAGVVNIILKRDFDGLEANTKYGRADEVDEWDNSVAWGKRWERVSLSIVGSYETRSELTGSERAITANQDYRPFGSADLNTVTCNPGNVFFPTGFSFNGKPPVQYAAVPGGFTGTPSIQEFAATAGTLNECSSLRHADLLAAHQREGVLASGNFKLTQSVELFAEQMYSHVQQLTRQGPPTLFGQPGFQSFTVPSANPFNPFGQTVGISGELSGLNTAEPLDTVFLRSLIGARGTLFERWNWEVGGWISSDRSRFTFKGFVDSTAVQNALNSTDPATALNPFVANVPGLSQLRESLLRGDEFIDFHGRAVSVNGFVRGPAFQLPSGPVEAVFGGEYERDTLSQNEINLFFAPPNTRSTFHRDRHAVFAETRIPILANHANPSSGDVLAATLAGRYDHDNDFGNKTTPQLGAELRPLETLLIRGTYARAFKAPSLNSLHELQASFPGNPVVDPNSGQTVIVTLLTGGNPNLAPETGQSRTFGFVYSSKSIPGLQLSLTHWAIDESNSVQQLPLQVIVDNVSLFPGRVIRNSAGVITQVNTTFINFGGTKVSGLDYQMQFKTHTDFGQFTPSLSATETYHYSTALLPGTTPTDRTSKANDDGQWAPRWKGTVALVWQLGPYSANVAGRYVGRYRDYDPLPNGSFQTLGNFWIYDANFRYGVGQAFAPKNQWLKEAFVELGGINLSNRLPQFSNYFNGVIGFDPTQADVRGRFLYGGVGVKW
jgi:iron complex outermembrane recepter protein